MDRLEKVGFYWRRFFEILFSEGVAELWNAVRRKGRQQYFVLLWKWKSLVPVRAGETQNFQVILQEHLIIFTGVPFDDIGGGQRSAQLTRCALKTGRPVTYVYIYKKYDFEMQMQVESSVGIPGLTHLFLEDVSPDFVFSHAGEAATVLFEFPHPKLLPFLEWAHAHKLQTVFELIDDWESSLGAGWFEFETYKKFLTMSDRVVGTAKVLVDKMREHGRLDAEYLPNAGNEYIFDKYRKYERPKDMPRGSVTALYFGSLYGDWFSWEILNFAAQENCNTSFVLIGDRPKNIKTANNIYFLGSKRVEELPAYLYHADMTLLPFVPGKISDAVSPIKVFEYLFMEKPVISTRLPEVAGYPNVHIAETKECFSELVKSVGLSTRDSVAADIFISQNSWFSRLDKLVRPRELFQSKISAIILIHNNERIVERCLQTLILNCSHYLKEIIVVDNLSSDNGPSIVESRFPNVRLIRNDRNGCASGRNLGARHATGDFVAFFDSDQWFTSGQFMSEALSILTKSQSIGAVGWVGGWFDKYRNDLGGMVVDDCPDRGMNGDKLQDGVRTDIGYLGTGGMILSRHVFNSLKGFDTEYDPTCFEDTDLSFQLKSHGYLLAYRDLAGIRHQPHQTTRAHENGEEYKKIFQRNAVYFKKKWAPYPQYFADYKE